MAASIQRGCIGRAGEFTARRYGWNTARRWQSLDVSLRLFTSASPVTPQNRYAKCPPRSDFPSTREGRASIRDYLRAHADEAAAYGALKAAIVEGGTTSLLAYSSAQATFIESLIAKALYWKQAPP